MTFEHIKNILFKKYSLFIVGLFILFIILLGIVKQDNIIVTINDNLDSNIPTYKMIRDNHLFWKYNEPLPYLGGTTQRLQYKNEYNFTSWIFYLFSPLVAYYIVYILKVLFSALGFYFLAKTFDEDGYLKANRNVWCLCGLLYGILGTWPLEALGFSSLPWLTLVIYNIYKKRKIKYIPFLLIFTFSTSTILIGIFALFYFLVFIFIVSIKDKKVCIPLVVGFFSLLIVSLLMNSNLIRQSISASKDTIKSLNAFVYDDSFFYCLSKFRTAFFFGKQYYHSGGSTLKYVVIPICSIFLLINIFKSIKRGKIGKKEFLYFIVFSCIVFNALVCCFDNYYLFRRIIPFANGFNFYRFSWISPFLWIILLAMVCNDIKRGFENNILLFAFLLILVDPRYTERNSMYNELYWNNFINYHVIRDSNHEWTWREYYSEKLFDEIKHSIDYNGEWAIAYGLEPSVLQYNGIKTLDGYYPNYPIWYHDIFEKMIQPELDIDKKHRNYWQTSTGMRAYIWSPEWDFYLRKKTYLKESYLHININIFRELNGKYIFSRVRIVNWNELGLTPINRYTRKGSPYKIYVYKCNY